MSGERTGMPAITSRDNEILDALTLRVRVLTVEQITRTWWSGLRHGRRAAVRRLEVLELAGSIHTFDMLAHPELSLESPIGHWRPGAPTPDFDELAYRLGKRWALPPIRHTAVIATRKSGRLYGGWGGRHPRPTERTHDLHMAAVFLRKRMLEPAIAGNWISEEKLRERGKGARTREKLHLPDAIVTRPRRTAIEFGGAYRVEKLRSFHTYCQRIGLSYEIW